MDRFALTLKSAVNHAFLAERTFRQWLDSTPQTTTESDSDGPLRFAVEEDGNGGSDFVVLRFIDRILGFGSPNTIMPAPEPPIHVRLHGVEREKLVSLGGLIISVVAIALTYDGSFVFDRPTQSAAIGFTSAGTIVLLLHFLSPRLLAPAVVVQDYIKIPLSDRHQSHAGGYPFSAPDAGDDDDNGEMVSPKVQRLLFIGTVIGIFLRVKLFQLILRNRPCTSPGVEGIIPLLLALYGLWRDQKKHTQNKAIHSHDPYIRRQLLRFFKYLGPAVLVSYASYLTSSSSNPRSTYICSTVSLQRVTVPLLQWAGTSLDCLILLAISALLNRRRPGEVRIVKSPIVVGCILLSSAAFLFLFGILGFVEILEGGPWVISIEAAYFRSLIWMTSSLTLMIISAIRIVTYGGAYNFALIVTAVCTYMTGCHNLLEQRWPFPPVLRAPSFLSTTFLGSGVGLYLYFGTDADYLRPLSARRLFARIPNLVYVFIAILFAGQIYLGSQTTNNLDFSPTESLMEQARELHNSWVLQASHSRTFQAAKDEYRRRYQRHPPPGFDKWYEYATARSSIIIDDFDSIFKDLLPFWALNPPTLRSLTAEIISNPWNELAKVSIRNGRAEFGDTIPTHGWMLEGIMEMLGNFAQWLPDMDLAFNINDESRVAIPYETYQQSQEIGLEIGRLDRKQDPKWSEDREHSWPILGESNQAPSRFYDHSFTRTFHSYGSISCPPNSTARTTRIWDVSRLCTRCISPHSLGPFLSNWTLSASPCHQPDVANLHGFYLSPSAFKTAREPIPVFSQSKAHGYADILYPSPWNYMDKIKYDPSDEVPDKPFSEKENTLFWRGATSEGFSTTGQWKGMTRQRLVYLTHNTTIHSVPNTAIPVPHPSKPGISTYVYVPPASLNLSINVGIVDKIVRSDDADYHYQAAQFAPLLPHSEFQDHWKYRYLVDVDGAGFSGRFLPFLLSKSLPFKAALFREWYDGRITAWKHFVPLDLRLHGLFPTLAYFAGANYRGTKLRSHERAGEEIAESGREWASKVLRKEDMEIYFFRLLLEWGRMTDDRRDEIGIDN